MKINMFSILMLICATVLIGISGSEAFGQDVNLALTANNPKIAAKQSSQNTWDFRIAGPATKAIDGDLEGGLGDQRIVETKSDDKDGWFEVDLGNYFKINKIVIHPRTDNCCTANFKPTVIVTDQPLEAKPMVDDAKVIYSSTYSEFSTSPISQKKVIETKGIIGRYIRLQMKGSDQIELAEIEIFGDKVAVAGHTPNPGKAWDAVLKIPFDPNFPNFLGTDPGKNPAYYGTLQGSPKIVVAKNSATSFDVAYQDLYGSGKTIRINTYEKSGTGFKKNAAESKEYEGLGTFAGFTKDAGKNRYVFTSQPWENYEQIVKAEVTKIPAQGNPDVIWKAKYYDGKNIVDGVESLMTGFYTGTSRLAIGGNSLLITTNLYPTHPYQVILDTADKSKNDNRAFYESAYHHNYGQRLIYDGKDFVIMENRDHDVTVTLTKLNPTDVLPLKNYAGGIFSVYSHTNFGNHTYTELGNVEKGLDDNNGYLVLFASERDWDDKMKDYKPTSETIKTWAQPQIMSPRDIGLVHVKKDFNKSDPTNPDKIMANWLNNTGEWMTQCPKIVDNSNFVNSSGTTKTIKYQTANDGWDWVGYSPKSKCESQGERSLITKGVKWVTNYGSANKAVEGVEFTSVNYPKLVRIAPNNYIAVWEEWTAKLNEPKSKYVTTKAALIILKAATNGEVNIELGSAPKDLGKIRLMPGDDAFEFDGKAAWAVGDSVKGKLMFYTIGADLKINSFELEP